MIRVSEVRQAGYDQGQRGASGRVGSGSARCIRQGRIRVNEVRQAGYDQGQRGASGRVGSGSARCVRQGRIRVSRMLKDLSP